MMEYVNYFNPKSFKSPYPWAGHLPFAVWLMKKIKPKVFVELGTHYGNSYFAFCQAATESLIDVRCYAVDTWRGEAHAGYYNDEVFNYVENHNKENYSQFSTLLRMNFDEAVKKFENSSIDLLHIDGLHTYDAVRHDFETWLPKVKPNGIVLFHDTSVKKDDFGVWKFWSELTKEYKFTIEFTHSNGLGVLQPSNVSAPSWLSKDENEKKDFLKYFERMGELFELRGHLAEQSKEVADHIADIKAYQIRLQAKEKEIQAHIDDIYAYRRKVAKLEVENSKLDRLLIDTRQKMNIIELGLTKVSAMCAKWKKSK